MKKQVTIKFENAPNSIPVNAEMDIDAPANLPDGEVGHVLTKTEDGVKFAPTIDAELPDGTVGQVLTKTEGGVEFADPTVELPAGTVGQLLTATADGVEFADPVEQVPALPTEDGEYKLVILEGVATWVSIT